MLFMWITAAQSFPAPFAHFSNPTLIKSKSAPTQRKRKEWRRRECIYCYKMSKARAADSDADNYVPPKPGRRAWCEEAPCNRSRPSVRDREEGSKTGPRQRPSSTSCLGVRLAAVGPRELTALGPRASLITISPTREHEGARRLASLLCCDAAVSESGLGYPACATLLWPRLVTGSLAT